MNWLPMSGFSDEQRRTLARVTLRQIQELLKILNTVKLCRLPFIEGVYKETAQYFHETLKFAVDLELVSVEGGEVIVSDECRLLYQASPTAPEIAMRILDRLLNRSTGVSAGVAEYLSQFNLVGDELEHRPSTHARLRDSAVRDFLMELGVVFYDLHKDRFVLTPDGVHCYLWSKNVRGLKSKRALSRVLKQKDELGSAAECAVMEFEKRRVGEGLAKRVEHVSAVLPFACYDIKSVTLQDHSDLLLPRYIEVKAVAPKSYKFFWTSSELTAAKLLGDAYFLYLLPVINGEFDLAKLLIIPKAYEDVYRKRQNWLIEENLILCQRKNPSN